MCFMSAKYFTCRGFQQYCQSQLGLGVLPLCMSFWTYHLTFFVYTHSLTECNVCLPFSTWPCKACDAYVKYSHLLQQTRNQFGACIAEEYTYRCYLLDALKIHVHRTLDWLWKFWSPLQIFGCHWQLGDLNFLMLVPFLTKCLTLLLCFFICHLFSVRLWTIYQTFKSEYGY